MGDWDTSAAVIFAARFLVPFCGPAPCLWGPGRHLRLANPRWRPPAPARRRSPPPPLRVALGPVPPVAACLCGTQGLARCPITDLLGQFGDRGVGHDLDPPPGCLLLEIV